MVLKIIFLVSRKSMDKRDFKSVVYFKTNLGEVIMNPSTIAKVISQIVCLEHIVTMLACSAVIVDGFHLTCIPIIGHSRHGFSGHE